MTHFVHLEARRTAFRDTLKLLPCKLDGGIPAADGLETLYALPSPGSGLNSEA